MLTKGDKITLLKSLMFQTEKHIHEAVEVFQNLETEVLLRPSSSGGWSIAQCLEHLNSYGRYYLPELKKSLEKAKLVSNEEEYTPTLLGEYFTKLMEPGDKMTKFKTYRKKHIPPLTIEPYKVVSEFIEQQEQLLQITRAYSQYNMSKFKISLSITDFIKIKPGDVLRFMIAHNERHILQAKKNLQ